MFRADYPRRGRKSVSPVFVYIEVKLGFILKIYNLCRWRSAEGGSIGFSSECWADVSGVAAPNVYNFRFKNWSRNPQTRGLFLANGFVSAFRFMWAFTWV